MNFNLYSITNIIVLRSRLFLHPGVLGFPHGNDF